MTDITIISAMAKNGVIGKNNGLPWHIPSEIQHYFNHIKGNITICGRNTYEAFKNPKKNYCTKVVVSRTLKKEGVWTFPDLEYALEFAILKSQKTNQDIYLCGGHNIYKEGLEKYANKMILSVIDLEPKGDTFFPNIPKSWIELRKKDVEDTINYTIKEYIKY